MAPTITRSKFWGVSEAENAQTENLGIRDLGFY